MCFPQVLSEIFPTGDGYLRVIDDRKAAEPGAWVGMVAGITRSALFYSKQLRLAENFSFLHDKEKETVSVADTRRLISKSTENENRCNKTERIMKIRINIQPPISSIGALLQSNRTHWFHCCETSQHVVRQLALKIIAPPWSNQAQHETARRKLSAWLVRRSASRATDAAAAAGAQQK